jgi:hypothetical protein
VGDVGKGVVRRRAVSVVIRVMCGSYARRGLESLLARCEMLHDLTEDFCRIVGLRLRTAGTAREVGFGRQRLSTDGGFEV